MKKIDLHPEARIIYKRFYEQYPPAQSVGESHFFMSDKSINDRIKLLYPPCRYIYLEKTKDFLNAAGYVLIDMSTQETQSDDKRYLIK